MQAGEPATTATTATTATSSRRKLWIAASVLLLAVASSFQLRLAPFAAIATLIAIVSTGREASELRRRQYAVLALAALLSAVAFVRFLVNEAVPGIVQGGTRAAEDRAVSRLREVLFGEDVARAKAAIDPDGDGIGSAALLAELTGEVGLRQGARLSPPLLERFGKTEGTAIGPAHLLGGYWFVVCLPLKGGGFSAEPDAAFDDEAAERRFLAYAWPASPQVRLGRAFFLDEHERVLIASAGPRQRTGDSHPPPCDDALAEGTRGDWKPWRKKQPRRSLPGDSSAGR